MEDYAKVQKEVHSLGLYAEEYENDLLEATVLAANYKIWEYDQQKAKMDDLCGQIKESDQKFQEFWNIYNEVVAEIEDTKKYFLGEYENDYTEQKQEFQDDLQNYKEQECIKLAPIFEKWKETIPEYNKMQLEKADREIAKWVKNKSDYYGYERKTLKDAQGDFQEAVQGENYLNAWNDYQEIVQLKKKYDNIPLDSAGLDSYYQMDAATENVIIWNMDNLIQ